MGGKQAKELRREMRRILSSLDERWLQAASRELCVNLSKILNEEIPREIDHVLAWVSHFPGEVDLTDFINEQLDRRQIYLPRALPDRNMSFISIGKDWLTSVAAGQFGIPEPVATSGQIYDPKWAHETAVIVPGLAFDDQGSRLGRGGGYYDRFFSKPPMMQSIKIGVCWSLQLTKTISTESHDAIMDWVCHERGFLRSGFEYDDSFDE